MQYRLLEMVWSFLILIYEKLTTMLEPSNRAGLAAVKKASCFRAFRRDVIK